MEISNISWGCAELRQLGGFSGLGAIVPSFVPAEYSGAGGYVGYIRKALEKGHLEHPGSESMSTVCESAGLHMKKVWPKMARFPSENGAVLS